MAAIKVSDEYKKNKYVNQYSSLAESAQQALAKNRAALSKPGTYTAQKNTALNDYLNRGKFNYDFNNDPMYKQYRDAYERQGKLAMMDTMGQAAALTGGYANSYAQSAGQQSYNQYMQQLNDIVPQLQEIAYNRYNQEGNDMLNRYSLLADADDKEYARLAEAYQRALSEYGLYSDQYNNERNFAYQIERNDVADQQWKDTFNYNKYRDEIADRQWQTSFDYQKEQDAAAAALNREKFDYQKQQDALDRSYQERKLAVSQAAAAAKATNDDGAGLYTFRGVDGENDGKMVFTDPNGKTVKVDKGINPYTGTKNKDIDNGTFSNGYQPNNINGKKLSKAKDKTGDYYSYNMNGREQNVWTFDGGKTLYVWDGTKNKYVRVED